MKDFGFTLQEVINKVQANDKEAFDKRFTEEAEKNRALHKANMPGGTMTASELLIKLAEDAGFEIPKKGKPEVEEIDATQQEEINAKLEGRFPPPPKLTRRP